MVKVAKCFVFGHGYFFCVLVCVLPWNCWSGYGFLCAWLICLGRCCCCCNWVKKWSKAERMHEYQNSLSIITEIWTPKLRRVKQLLAHWQVWLFHMSILNKSCCTVSGTHLFCQHVLLLLLSLFSQKLCFLLLHQMALDPLFLLHSYHLLHHGRLLLLLWIGQVTARHRPS